jgi:hypothetical protein
MANSKPGARLLDSTRSIECYARGRGAPRDLRVYLTVVWAEAFEV